MRARTKILFGTAMICAGALALQPDAVASAPPTTVCALDEANQWAESNVSSLPRNLSEIEELPVARQKAVMARLSPAERAAVWREHFALVLSDGAITLTTEQREVLRDLDSRLESILVPESTPEREAALARLVVFEPSLRAQLFMRLSDSSRETVCSCNNAENDCGSGPVGSQQCEVEMHPSLACTPTWGCGTLWLHTCNGTCMGGGSGGGNQY